MIRNPEDHKLFCNSHKDYKSNENNLLLQENRKIFYALLLNSFLSSDFYLGYDGFPLVKKLWKPVSEAG